MSGEFRNYLLEKLARNAHLYNKFDRIKGKSMVAEGVTVVPPGCPVCHRPNDRVSPSDGKNGIPTEGDLSVCFWCGAFLTFNADLTQRELTLEEVGNLPDENRIEMQRVRKAMKRLRGKYER